MAVTRQFVPLRCAMPGVLAVQAESAHRFDRHTHAQFGIGVLLRGAQKSLSGRGVVEAGRGDVITVNPGEVHDGAPIGDAGRAWRMLYLEPTVVAQAMADIREGVAAPFEFSLPVLQDARLAAAFGQLFAALTRPDAVAPALQTDGLLIGLLAQALRPRGPSYTPARVPPAIALARSRIDDDPTASPTLPALAAMGGISQFQLLRGFAKATGLTPHAYLLQRRVDLARSLIARGHRLADAAADSGFADQSHMTRVFVRKYGLSPRAFADALR